MEEVKIDLFHRVKLVRFLFLKTAAVRAGLKPAELLRVRHCYPVRNSEGFQFCMTQSDVLNILKLEYLELRTGSDSSLFLFYHPITLESRLKELENRALLKNLGYPGADVNADLQFLIERFNTCTFPHEVGVFIGYPVKDVAGFIANLPPTPIHRNAWQVYGNPAESVALMSLYRRFEAYAEEIFDTCSSLQEFYRRITHHTPQTKELIYGSC